MQSWNFNISFTSSRLDNHPVKHKFDTSLLCPGVWLVNSLIISYPSPQVDQTSGLHVLYHNYFAAHSLSLYSASHKMFLLNLLQECVNLPEICLIFKELNWLGADLSPHIRPRKVIVANWHPHFWKKTTGFLYVSVIEVHQFKSAMNHLSCKDTQTAVWQQENAKCKLQGANCTVTQNYHILMWRCEWCPQVIRSLGL